jgi:hypothetical protein
MFATGRFTNSRMERMVRQCETSPEGFDCNLADN